MSRYSASIIIVLSFVGCSRSDLDLAPVEGVVTLQGTPVEGAGVMFFPQAGPSAFGITDATGRFALVTANEQGALIGPHSVSIVKDETVTIPQQRGFPLYKVNNLIPAKYADSTKSGLTADVEDDDNYFEFKLDAK